MLNVIEERLDEPTARGLANAIGRAVSDGALRSGMRLPPIRTVAVQLALSPTTVSSAWNMLARSGTIQTDGRRGTVISAHRAGPARYRDAIERVAGYELDLSTGTPDPALLPDLRPALRRIEFGFTVSSYLDDPVLPALEELLRSDWPFPAERLAVVDGAMDAMALIAASLLHFGDRVGVEQPCFVPLLDLLDSLGVVPVPIRLDENGPRPDDVRAALDAGVKVIFIQPRAQNPTGISVTSERMDELAAVLRRSEAVVVEDDSAGAISSSPALSLGALLPERTLHVRSYSKSHGPDLRLAAIGGPAELVDALVDRRFLSQGWTSRLLQSVLVDLLTHAPTIRAVDRARDTYRQRREDVVTALRADGVDVRGTDGLNIWVPVRDEPAALLRLATHGIGVLPGRPFWVGSPGPSHVRVTAGLITTRPADVAAELAAAALTGETTAPR